MKSRFSFLLFTLMAFVCSACLSPDEYKEEADEAAYGIIARARSQTGEAPDPDFNIDMSTQRLRDSLILARSLDQQPGPRERLALAGEAVDIDLATALDIASRNSREYQTEKERLYLAALSLTTAVHDFETNWFGLQSFDASSTGDGDDSSSLSLAENGSFGFTRLLEAGGALTLSIGDNIARFLSNPAETVATTFASLTLSLPFLRGAGREVAYENVTQSERDVVYALRDFERFKKEFAVDIISDYLRLLQNDQTVINEAENFKRRQITALENRALGEAGRLARTDVERANQAELSAENRVILARQNFADVLDVFNLTLGLPTDANLIIARDDLVSLREVGADPNLMTAEEATLVAIKNRLDLGNSHGRAIDARRQISVTRDALLAGLDFNASIDLNSNDFGSNRFRLDPIGNADYALGFDIDLPFDRIIERNAYRQALISYEVSKRNYEALEDTVKLQVRRALRSLLQTSESYRIQLVSLQVSKTNVDAASLLKDAGQGSTLDLLDAQNDLISAENAVTAALINFKIAELQLLRDMGVLVVDAEGINYELTNKRLAEKE